VQAGQPYCLGLQVPLGVGDEVSLPSPGGKSGLDAENCRVRQQLRTRWSFTLGRSIAITCTEQIGRLGALIMVGVAQR
jgi:hypothetical protein